MMHSARVNRPCTMSSVRLEARVLCVLAFGVSVALSTRRFWF